MARTTTTRRAFLETIGGLGAAAISTAATLESARGYPATDTLNVGCLGTGGRCQTLMRSLAQVPGVRIAAVCDIYDAHLAGAKKLADPRAFATKHYREVLDRKDIDAVLIGSPDHWHVPMSVDACNAGKDVYVEKPLTHDLAEGAAIVEAQNQNRKIVQVGMQQRSMPHIQKARELIKSGRIGEVFKVHLSWNRGGSARFQRGRLGIDPNQVAWKDFLGSAPDQAFDEYRFRNWRWFWDFGGGVLTDLMVHWIDVAHWILEVDHPKKATSIGNHFASKDLWQTPDTIQCILEYPNNVQAHFEGTFSNANLGAMITFMGTTGTMYIDRGRYELTPEGGKQAPEQWILGSNPRKGADFYDKPDGELLHLTNWVECIRSRQRPNAPAEAGVSAAAAAHLGNRAYRSGQVAEWVSS
ncbi:MAG: Gfo/Idh/MocA family protein [Isosphaerales bacterium]